MRVRPLLLVAGFFPVLASAAFTPDAEYAAQAGLATINAAAAYNLGITGAGVRIGIIDSGINPDHQEFAGAVAAGYNFFNNSSVLSDDSSIYHGSHVAGVAGARRDGNGMMGVAYESGLVIGATDYSSGQLSAAINFAVTQKSAVINNSWGYSGTTILSYDRNSIESTFPDLVAALQNAVSNNTVVVFANGNDGASQPQVFGGLPYYFPEFERNWITVVASTDDGKFLTPYSNRCGVAAAWCVAAPGGYSGYDTGIYSVDGATTSGYKDLYGTSVAAPSVSGEIALIAQRFPYMTAEQLVSVLLTTAKHGTDTVLSTLYGRGLIDVAKAMNGPAAFEFTFDVDTQGFDSVWSNNIIGNGGLVKRGAGVLELTGANTFTGGVTLAGGTLLVSADANLGASTSGVDLDGGTLRIGGDLSSARTFSVDAGGGVLDTQGFVMTLSGALHGSGLLQKAGSGTLLLQGSSDFTGTTEIDAGTVVANASSLTGNVDNRATLVMDQATDGTFNGNIAGSGLFVKQGSGNLRLDGSNTYTGGSDVQAGTLTGNTVSLQGAISNSATVVFDQAQDGSYAGAMTGSGQLVKQGNGRLVLTGANTYSGGTVIAAGTLEGDTASLQGAFSGAGVLDVNQASAGDFAGSLGGVGIFQKSGAGTLRLGSGGNSAGAASVYGGVLQVDGSLAAPVTVFSGGSLSGGGTLTGNVTIAAGGRLLVSAATGAPAVTGSLDMAAGSTFGVTVSGQAPVPVVSVSGPVTLGGGAVSVTASGSLPALSRQVLLQSGQPLQGTFGSVSTNVADLRGFMAYGPDDAALVLARIDPFLAGQVSGFNRTQAANGLTAALGTGFYSDSFATQVNTLYQSSPATISQAMDSVSGEVVADTAPAVSRWLGNFMFDLPAGSQQRVRQALTAPAWSPAPRRPAFADFQLSGPQAWAYSSGQHSTVQGTADAGGYAFTHGLVAAGMEGAADDRVSVGLLLLQGQQTLQRNGAPDQSDSTLSLGGLYLRQHDAELELALMLAAGQVQTDTQRWIEVGGGGSKAVSDSHASLVLLSAGVRYPLSLQENLTLSPLLMLNAVHMNAPAFTESGGGAFGLTFASAHSNTASSDAGAELQFSDPAVVENLHATASLRWRHDFTGPDSYTLDASFTAMPAAGFEVRPAAMPVDTALFQGGVHYGFTPRFLAAADVNAEAGHGFSSRGISASLQYAW